MIFDAKIIQNIYKYNSFPHCRLVSGWRGHPDVWRMQERLQASGVDIVHTTQSS